MKTTKALRGIRSLAPSFLFASLLALPAQADFVPGSGGAIPVIAPLVGIPNQIGGLRVSQIDRENHWFGGTRPILDLSFPPPSTHGASSYTLQTSSDGGSNWTNLYTTSSDSQDNFSFNPDGNYLYRLLVSGGPKDAYTSNVVSAPLTSVETRFAGWNLDESMFITGVMMPWVGRGITASFTVRKLSDDSDVTDGLTYQWFRVNPLSSETFLIPGATGQTYATTMDDVGGYQLICKATGDEMTVGGFCQIGSSAQVLVPNNSFASEITSSGFRLNLHKSVTSLTASDLNLTCWNGTETTTLAITSVTALPGNASFDIVAAIPSNAQDLWLANQSNIWSIGQEITFFPGMPPHFMQSLRITLPTTGGGFSAWVSANSGIPVDRRGALDTNGPMDLQNLMAYAMGVDPMTATTNDLPFVSSMDAQAGTIHFIYRRAKNLTDVILTPLVSPDLRSWKNGVVISETPTDHGTYETVDALLSFSPGPMGFLKLAAESVP